MCVANLFLLKISYKSCRWWKKSLQNMIYFHWRHHLKLLQYTNKPCSNSLRYRAWLGWGEGRWGEVPLMRPNNKPSEAQWGCETLFDSTVLNISERKTEQERNSSINALKEKDKPHSSKLANKVWWWNKSVGRTSDQTFSGPIYFPNVGDIISVLG